MRGPGAAELLHRALAASAARAGASIAIARACATGWQSATFAGARHVIEASAPAAVGLDRWLRTLPDADIPLPGHLLADLAVTAIDRAGSTTGFRIEALTVEGD